MTESLLPYQPSIGSATGTRLDTACRHHQQCRISTDDMLQFTLPNKMDHEELQRHKYRYCIHKDEFVVGIGRPWKPEDTRKRVNNAYPRVIGNLGMLSLSDHEGRIPLMMIRYMNHFARSLPEKAAIIEWFRNAGEHAPPRFIDPATNRAHPSPDPKAVAFNHEDKARAKNWLPLMADQISVGYANTLGWAHPNTGDTMVTVMIGGLRTVMNGDFEVFTGDLIQWYWPFEKDCFDARGARHKYVNTWTQRADQSLVPPNVEPTYDPDRGIALALKADRSTGEREAFYDRGFGMPAGSPPKMVPRIKPYVRDDDNPRIFDGYRVFATALSPARPHEPVDIKISRQSA